MKKFSLVFKYLAEKKANIALYFLFNLLSIVFSLVSLAMLAPFLQQRGHRGLQAAPGSSLQQQWQVPLLVLVAMQPQCASPGLCLVAQDRAWQQQQQLAVRPLSNSSKQQCCKPC